MVTATWPAHGAGLQARRVAIDLALQSQCRAPSETVPLPRYQYENCAVARIEIRFESWFDTRSNAAGLGGIERTVTERDC